MYGNLSESGIPIAKFSKTRKLYSYRYFEYNIVNYCQQIIAPNWLVPTLEYISGSTLPQVSYCQQIINPDWSVPALTQATSVNMISVGYCQQIIDSNWLVP
jgi:hypothetical protein